MAMEGYSSDQIDQMYQKLIAHRPDLKSYKSSMKAAVLLEKVNCKVDIGKVLKSGFNDTWLPLGRRIIPPNFGPGARHRLADEQRQLLTDYFTISDSKDKWPYDHYNLSQRAVDDETGFPASLVLKDTLGSADFGAPTYVAAVEHSSPFSASGSVYALKRIERKRDTFSNAKAQMRYIQGELEALRKIRHRHCIRLVASYTEPHHVGILMYPVADYNLLQYLDRFHTANGGGDSFELARFFGCLATTLSLLHNKYRIRHKDIKPENILVKRSPMGQNMILFTDFGLALDWEEKGHTTTQEETFRSPKYCAPEAAADKERNSQTDIWSLGCVFLEMITVLKGKERKLVDDMMKSYGHEYFRLCPTGIDALISYLRNEVSRCGNAPLDWIKTMLQQDKDRRPFSEDLVDTIVKTKPEGRLVFCGPCCTTPDDDDDDEDSGYGGDLGPYQQEHTSPISGPATARPEETPMLDPPTGALATPPLQLEPKPNLANSTAAQSRWFIRVFEQDAPGREELHYVEVVRHPGSPRNWISPAMVQQLRLAAGNGQRYCSLVFQGVRFRSNRIVRVSWVGKDMDRFRRSDFSIAETRAGKWPFQLLVGAEFIRSFGASDVFFRTPGESQLGQYLT